MFIETVHAVTEIGRATAETAQNTAESGGVLGALGINLKLFIAQLVNFGIIFLVLWRWAYKPILKILNDRKKMVEESIENAEKAKTSMQMAELAYKKKVDEAVNSANTVIAHAQEQGDKVVAESRQKAKEEVERVIVQARAVIQTEKEQARKEIKTEVIEVVIQTVEKVLAEKLDAKKDVALVKRLVE